MNQLSCLKSCVLQVTCNPLKHLINCGSKELSLGGLSNVLVEAALPRAGAVLSPCWKKEMLPECRPWRPVGPGAPPPPTPRIACHHFVRLSEHSFLLYSLQIRLGGSLVWRLGGSLHQKKTPEAKILVLLTNYQSQVWKGAVPPKCAQEETRSK